VTISYMHTKGTEDYTYESQESLKLQKSILHCTNFI